MEDDGSSPDFPSHPAIYWFIPHDPAVPEKEHPIAHRLDILKEVRGEEQAHPIPMKVP